MFFIVNKTKQTIVLGDIGVHLGPRQAIDLDKVVKREKSENSAHLKAAKHKGDIEIRIKDSDNKAAIPDIAPNKPSNFDKIKDDIVNELKGSIQQLAQQISSQSQTPNIVLSDENMNNLTQKILARLPNQSYSLPAENVEMDKDIVADLNARAVNKIVKDTDIKSVKYKEEVQNGTILDNIDELDKLLG